MIVIPPWILESKVTDGAKLLYGHLLAVQRLGITRYPLLSQLELSLKKLGRTIRKHQYELEEDGWLVIQRDGRNVPKTFLVADVRSQLIPPSNRELGKPSLHKRVDSSSKDKDKAIAKTEQSYSYAKEVEKLLLSPQRRLQVIGIYFMNKELTLDTRKNFNSELRRNLRISDKIVEGGWDDERLHKTMQYLVKYATEVGYLWTLEGVLNKIAEV